MTEIGVQEVWLICDACETDYKLIRSHNDPAFPDESKLVKRNKKEVEASNEV